MIGLTMKFSDNLKIKRNESALCQILRLAITMDGKDRKKGTQTTK